MKYGMTELKEQQVLRENIPSLFEGSGKELLYVGANQIRPPHHAGTLVECGWTLHLLEAFMGNIEFHGANELWETITWGNVTKREEIPKRTFDVVMWWHGVEHVARETLSDALINVQGMATTLVVLGCPHGRSPQQPVYGNKLERHKWSVFPKDLEKYGYEVVPYQVHVPHMLAWKWVS